MSIEIEIKLSFSPSALPEILCHPLIAGAPRETPPEVLDNTYFDTPEWTLRARGVGLRLRQQTGGTVQTVKCSAHQALGGLTRRPEWETPWRGQFDFSAVTDPDVAALLEQTRGKLAPVFATRFLRDTRRIQPHPGLSVLAMIDTGIIEAGKNIVKIHELELELVNGIEESLIRLAEELQKKLPLTPENVSKAQRGYQLATASAC